MQVLPWLSCTTCVFFYYISRWIYVGIVLAVMYYMCFCLFFYISRWIYFIGLVLAVVMYYICFYVVIFPG